MGDFYYTLWISEYYRFSTENVYFTIRKKKVIFKQAVNQAKNRELITSLTSF